MELTQRRSRHSPTKPYTLRMNGKVERFNGALARESAYVREPASEALDGITAMDRLRDAPAKRHKESLW